MLIRILLLDDLLLVDYTPSCYLFDIDTNLRSILLNSYILWEY